ncbi:MAG: hypothetical protein ABIG42_07905, partial [bacterium]
MRLSKFVFIILSVVIIAGCSSNGTGVVTPDNSGPNSIGEEETYANDPLIVSNISDEGVITGGVGTLGFFEGNLNLKTLEATLTPLRSSGRALEDSLVVDITTFLKISPCADCVKIGGVSLDSQGNPVLKIGVSHPFPPGDKNNEPSPTNRLDLHVFSARGFVISDGLTGGGYKEFVSLSQKVPGW